MDFSFLSIRELRSILSKRGLSSSNNKAELVKRLGEHLKAEQENSIIENNEENDEEDSDDNSGADNETDMAANFVFKDVEDALEVFDGETGKNITDWLKEFEDISTVCAWSDIQKYLFARKLLRGAAKLAIETSTGIGSYAQLIAKLKAEFKDTISSAEVHDLLRNRKKTAEESFIEYFYRMKQIANKGKVDEESVVSYIIAGIPDDPQNKVVLYDATTIEELKSKLKTYQNFKDAKTATKSTSKGSYPHFQRKDVNRQGGSTERCKNCGATSHVSQNCPHRSKGSRCFRCNEFGHIAKNCSQQPTEKKTPAESNVNRVQVSDMHVDVYLVGEKINSLLDTGSDVTLMKQYVYDRLKSRLPLLRNPIDLAGFGRSIKQTIGSFQATIIIDNEDFHIPKCHVVPNDYISDEMIIGKDIVCQANVNITAGQVKLSKAHTTETTCFKDDENAIFKMDAIQLIQKREDEDLQHIENINVREEVKMLLSSYNPKKPEKSCVQMEIVLEDEKPIQQLPRRLAPIERKVVNDQVHQWLNEGIIKESKSEFSSPIVLVKKKDGGNRLCVDFRKINEKIMKDCYPLPRIDDVLDALYNATIYTTLDLKNGFFHVDIKQECQKYTSFVTPDGQFEFLKAPFGLCNSPAIFQRYIAMIFQKLVREDVLQIYVDDIVIPARTEEESLEKLRKVFKVAEENGVTFKWEKSKYMVRKIEFLGHIIESGNVKPSTSKTNTIKHFPIPKNTKHVQSFIGLAAFFRKFIRNFSTIAKPLTDLTRDDVKFGFGEKEREAFETLKYALCDEPILKLYNPDLETELHTDASKVGLGAILLQKHDANFHPVFYVSFKTKASEINYTSFELEVLAIIRALKKLRIYLIGIPFKIFTDCKAFQQTVKKKDICPRVARWTLELSEFNCTVHHKSGSLMKHVDALSRYPAVYVLETGMLHRIRNAQSEDAECKLISDLLKNGNYKDYYERSGVIYRFVDGNYILVVPKTMQRIIIKNIHEQDHSAAHKVKAIVSRDYDIPKLNKKIEGVINNCVTCILATKKLGKKECFLNPIQKIDVPLHTLHVDHLGPLPSTAKTYKHLLLVVDAFTKFVWIYPTKSTTAEEAIKKLEDQREIFGNPYRIISDKGSAFNANIFNEYCEQQKIIHISITTGVPRGNGQAERVNGIIVPVLTRMAIEDPLKWYKFVPRLQTFINSSTSRSTKRSPFEMLFGVPIRRLEDHNLAKIMEEELIDEFENSRIELRQLAKQQIEKVQAENKKYFDRKRKAARKYNLRDLVAIQRTQFGSGLKLQPKYHGPYEVVKVNRNDRYQLQKVGVHEGPNRTSSAADLMKPWIRDIDSDSSSGTDD